MGIDIMKLIVWIQVLIKETICCQLGNSHNPTWISNPPHKRVDRWVWIWPILAWFYVFCIFQLGLNNLYWVEHFELNVVNISFNVYHHQIHVSTLQRATIQDGIVIQANWFPKKKKRKTWIVPPHLVEKNHSKITLNDVLWWVHAENNHLSKT